MKNSKSGERSLFSFSGGYRVLTVFGCILSGISAVLSLGPLLCIWFAVREILYALPGLPDAGDLSRYGWMAVWFAVGSILVYFIALMCTHLVAFRTARNMRSEALHHLVRLPLGYFTEKGSGRLRQVIDESAGQTETFLAHQLPDLTGAFVTPAAMLVLLFVFDWRLGLAGMAPMAAAAFFFMRMMGPNLASSMAEYQNALEDMNNEAVEYVRGIPVVKTFQQTVYSFKNFHSAILRYKEWAVNYTLKLRISNTSAEVAVNGVFAFLIPVGILLIGNAADYRGFLLNLIFYIILTPLGAVMMTRIMFAGEAAMKSADATKRINGVLAEKPLPEPGEPKQPRDWSVAFENVTFAYPGSAVPALKQVSFTIGQGETVALVGPSGGGKTTAACLIPRFFDVREGSVSVGGADVRQIASEELMRRVSFVFQDTRLLKASLLENIRAARPGASREEVLRAAEAAQCSELLAKLPDGLDTVVGVKGVYLSGGEMQRVALARAILKDAPIVLLDEATAFADPENEHRIQSAFRELTKGKTVLMIAHRLSTIRNADCILVFKEGRICERGTHDELLSRDGLYANMWAEYQSSAVWKVGKAGKEAC